MSRVITERFEWDWSETPVISCIPVRLSSVVLRGDRCFGFFWNYFHWRRRNVGMNGTLFFRSVSLATAITLLIELLYTNI